MTVHRRCVCALVVLAGVACAGHAASIGTAGLWTGSWAFNLPDGNPAWLRIGETVIDNQPLIGCTGGGISADDTKPGPIFLQGDHTSISYRNIVLRPVVKKAK